MKSIKSINLQIIVLIAFLSSISWSIRKIFLKKMDLYAFTYIECIFISSLILTYCLYKLGFKKCIDIPLHLSKTDINYLSILATISTFCILGMHHLISEEEISVLSPLIRGLKTIFISIIGMYLLNESVSQKKIAGILIIISGLVLLV